MTKQEIFDKVSEHLLAQGERAWDEHEERCVFLDSEGRKCAVGCLIPDDLYCARMEGCPSASSLFIDFPEEMSKAGLYIEQTGFLGRLQNVHDDEDPYYWRDRLLEVADEWGLSAGELTND